MRREDELTKRSIEFTVNGYKNNILDWLKLTVDFFNANGFPLKSVDYDWNHNKYHRKSLKTFYKQLEGEPTGYADKMYSFTVFSGVTQKYPATWYYGCDYDEPSQRLKLFFNTSFPEQDILNFYKNYLKAMLKNQTVWTGFLYEYRCNNLYSVGGQYGDTLNYYKEKGTNWKIAMIEHKGVLNKNVYRHIYEQNILSKYHMEEKFDGISLTEWVDKKGYGSIEKIGQENWLWIVPKDKLHEIQVIFYDKGLLIGVE